MERLSKATKKVKKALCPRPSSSGKKSKKDKSAGSSSALPGSYNRIPENIPEFGEDHGAGDMDLLQFQENYGIEDDHNSEEEAVPQTPDDDTPTSPTFAASTGHQPSSTERPPRPKPRTRTKLVRCGVISYR